MTTTKTKKMYLSQKIMIIIIIIIITISPRTSDAQAYPWRWGRRPPLLPRGPARGLPLLLRGPRVVGVRDGRLDPLSPSIILNAINRNPGFALDIGNYGVYRTSSVAYAAGLAARRRDEYR